jgi:deoxyribodipyrimidine photo-lyase
MIFPGLMNMRSFVIIRQLNPEHEVFLGELIWREFFMQILWHFPEVVNNNFNPRYNGIDWRNDAREFEQWCNGKTGYPMVDAGMRQLNMTGYMHNRVRMVVAGFLCKHLLINWTWGEAYFAKKLLDYELSSNNGNWQWAAGTGCDAAPYFRIFNPGAQLKKFDREETYVRQWIPEYGTKEYPEPMVEHRFARDRALKVYKKGMFL